MCVITTTALAAGGTALTFGLGGLSVTTGALATTAVGAGLLTAGAVAGSAALGAAASVGIAAATGAKGKDLGRAALIGGATGGLLSGIGSLGAVSSAFTQTGKTAADVAARTGEAANNGLTTTETLAQGTSGPWEVGTTVGPEITGSAEVAEKGLTFAEKIALGVGLASGAATGVTQGIQAHEEAKALQRQAKHEEIRAEREEEAGQREAIDAARKAKQERGTGIAQMAANGVMVDDAREGSVPTMYDSDLAAELAYDQSKIMYNANLRAWGYRSNAAELRSSAKTRRRAGYVSAGLSGLTAGLSAYGRTKTLLS